MFLAILLYENRTFLQVLKQKQRYIYNFIFILNFPFFTGFRAPKLPSSITSNH